jgi:Ca2+-binding RTX toxin-like protein
VQDIAGNPSELILNHSVNHLVADDDVETLAGDYKSVLLQGSDSINAVGNYSSNTMTGNHGDNILVGLPGADTLTGGLGADRFVYRNAFDSHLGDSIAYYDHITDFNPSEDFIQLPSGSSSLLKKLAPVAALTHASISDGFVAASIEAHDIVLFEVGQQAFIVANDSDPAYSAKDDVLIEVTGTPLDSIVSTNFEFG